MAANLPIYIPQNRVITKIWKTTFTNFFFFNKHLFQSLVYIWIQIAIKSKTSI